MIKDYTKIGIAAALFIFLIFVIVQIVEFSGREGAANKTYANAEAAYQEASATQAVLQEDYNYYSDPANVDKALRSSFNYTLPGEKVLILVPDGSSTGAAAGDAQE